MSTTGSRIGVIAACLGLGFGIVLLHLWFVMVQNHELWTRRSHENRWSFRSVPSQRGALRDRQGELLAYDEPTMQLSLYYWRFRWRHPVGAAVHGATAWANSQVGGCGTTYSYFDGGLGPSAAARDLLDIPTRALQRRVLPKEEARDLANVATTVLSHCSGLSRKRVFAALRQAAQAGGAVAFGDVLATPRSELLAAFEQSLASLRRFDADVAASQRARSGGRSVPDDHASLLDTLEFLRRASLRGDCVQWVDKEGKQRTGSKLENVRRNFADHVPFELAAQLRIGAEQHPGLEVAPSIRRVQTEPEGSSLSALLGSVSLIDRALPDEEWFERHEERELPDGWLEDIVPTGSVATDEERDRLQQEAKQQYERALMLRERRGINGLEAAFDDALMGRLGMRFVEHDRQRREHLLWSHLQVQSGEDVAITIDLRLQHAAEQVVQVTQAKMAAKHADVRDRELVEAAIAVIDARTGDVLAYAGAPIVSRNARDVPGVVWPHNGAIGSVVKPFVLIEQLQSEAMGRPHRAIASLDACTGKMVFQNRVIRCSHAHGEAARDPVHAMAESCNAFFCQCGEGLGDSGLARALRRFGLLEPQGPDDPFAPCWQPWVRGLGVAQPRMRDEQGLAWRSVGYGVEAS
ncbi:MAG: penicillin-binding transpeptidase domain-containing protein, partial [Planctomycetota bacterium]